MKDTVGQGSTNFPKSRSNLNILDSRRVIWSKLHIEDLHISGHAINLLKPTGYMMHHQFHIQQLYALPTLYLCVLYLSENK